MNWKIRLWGAALALALNSATAVRSQEAAGPQKHFYNKTSFRIPVVIDDAERATLAELKLFVRQGNGEWNCVATAPATQKHFVFQAQRDGEYWFNIATVDKTGKMTPEDLRSTAAALVVVVDTQAPEIDVKPMTAAAGQAYLQCRLVDANPDYASIRLQHQTADGTWQAMDGVANSPGLVQVNDPKILEGRVRVKTTDRAGNVGEREFDLSSNKVAAAASNTRPMPPRIPVQDDLPPVREPAPVRPASDVRSTTQPDGPLTPPSLDSPANSVVVPSATATANKLKPISPYPSDGAPLPPARPAAIERPAIDPLVKSPDLGTDGPRGDGAAMACINSTRCRLDFALDPVPGGIAEVEVWATTDAGRTWKTVGVSKDGKSPAVVDFPGEGKYGVAFVVRPVTGLTSALPKSGEAPDGWLEVDTTLPTAELLGVTPGTGSDVGFLVLRWAARDANLGNEPIAFWYSTQPGGPWQMLSDHMANSGTYRWPLPKNVASNVWVRMEVRDRAGNVTRCETPSPVALEGPRARVRVLNIGPARE